MKKSLLVVLFLSGLFFLFSLSGCLNLIKQNETIFYNGTIITMTEDKKGKPIINQAVLFKNGIILKTGTNKEVFQKAGRNAKKHDLNGAVVLPGLIDSHSHISTYAQTLAIAQLGQSKDFDDIVETMKSFMEESNLKDGEWLVGFGYDHNNLKEHNHPTREILDKISKDIPILITHTSGHMGVFNTKALEIIGVNSATKNPQGGVIGREQNSQEPNGYMEETAFVSYSKKSKTPEADFDELLKRAENSYFKYGVTTTQDELMGEKEFALITDAASKGILKIDTVGYIDLKDAKQIADKNKELHNSYKNHFKIGGFKIFLDGSPQGRTAWLTKPYIPVNGSDPNYRGYPVYKDEEVESFIKESLADGMSLHAHCNGDAAADQFINSFKKVIAEDNIKDTLRPTMIHTQVIRPEQFIEMEKIGMIPSMFPAHIWYWGDTHIANLGWERGCIVSAVNSARRAGTKYTFHQDTPVIPPDMLESIWCAVNRITKNGVHLAEFEKVTPYEALKAATVNGAYEIWEENSKGTIEKGKLADLVILDKNPLTVDSMEIKNIKVLETIKDGETVYKAD